MCLLWLFFCVCTYSFSLVELLPKKRMVISREIIRTEYASIVPEKESDKLSNLETTEFKREFIRLDIHAKMLYLLTIDVEQYERFLGRFKNEAEWGSLYNSLSQEERKHMPRTLQEQRALLRDCYYMLCAPTSMFPGYERKKAVDSTDDFAFWKARYYENNDGYLSDNPYTKEQLLKIEFFSRRLRLFNIPS